MGQHKILVHLLHKQAGLHPGAADSQEASKHKVWT